MILEPGIYPRTHVRYAEIEAVNQSSLVHIARSPLHYRAALAAARKETAGMRLGDVAHAAVLEPEMIGLRYAVWIRSDGGDGFQRSKELDAFRAQAELHGKTVIKQSELDEAMAIASAIRRSALAQRYLRRGQPEVTIVWRDEATGILCKGRIDMLSTAIEGADIGVELKTTYDIAEREFCNRFATAQYDVQSAFYADGYRAVTGRTLHMKCVSIESDVPYDVGVWDLTEVVDWGREYYREMLTKLKACMDSDEWPGQYTEERTLRLPYWRIKRFEEADVDGDEL